MGVSQQAVDKWERGEANPRVELLPKLAALLCCSVDELLYEPTDFDRVPMCVAVAKTAERVEPA